MPKAADIDDLSGCFLKDGSRVLLKPISELCNLSIKLETFSNPCKIVKMKPLFKKGFKTHSSSYRPILLLPLISKIIAKLIHEQTSCFYVTMKFYTTTNQDFLKPLDRLIFLLQTYVFAWWNFEGFDKGLMAGMMLIDLQKEFDMIDQKLSAMSFSNHTIRLNQTFPIDCLA